VANLKGHRSPIVSVSFAPDGRRVYTLDKDGNIGVFDSASGRPLTTSTGGGCLALSPDGRRIVTMSGKSVVVLDAMSFARLRTFPAVQVGYRAAAFDARGARVGGTTYRRFMVWNAFSGKELLGVGAHANWITSIAFSPDGRHLATGSHDDTVQIWDTSGKSLRTLSTGGTVNSLQFSPDGKALLAGAKRAHLWEVDTGQELASWAKAASLAGHVGGVNCARFRRDGRMIATASGSHTARIWAEPE
jgi:WD40 repeat protein